jgi:general secretion pathway protein G
MTRSSNLRRRLAHRPGQPAGFTLVELLVVIVILAILIALLLPAIAAGVRNARVAAVQAEITQLASALSDFKAKYGEYPPSRMLLCEDGVYPTNSTVAIASTGNTSDITLGQLAQRSVNALRRYWPRMDIRTGTRGSTTPPTTTTSFYDFNGNGVRDSNPYIIEGFECLVFWLGGVPAPLSASGASMTGWSKLPTNPFQNTNVTTNRYQPFFEFKSDRLLYLHGDIISAGGSGSAALPQIPAYLDSLGNSPTVGGSLNFYAYFSSGSGGTYDPNDCNLPEMDNMGGNPGLQFSAGFQTLDSDGNTLAYVVSPAPNPYTAGPPFNTTGTKAKYQNPQSFQLFSPGTDGNYGWGGHYAGAAAAAALPLDGVFTPTTSDGGIRTRERDNITNFKNGTLD